MIRSFAVSGSKLPGSVWIQSAVRGQLLTVLMLLSHARRSSGKHHCIGQVTQEHLLLSVFVTVMLQ